MNYLTKRFIKIKNRDWDYLDFSKYIYMNLLVHALLGSSQD